MKNTEWIDLAQVKCLLNMEMHWGSYVLVAARVSNYNGRFGEKL